MEGLKKGFGGVISDIVDKVALNNQLSLLASATSESDSPTPGYMFEQIVDVSYESTSHCQELTMYLLQRLEKPSLAVKLKVLKVLLHLVKHGHVSIRWNLRNNDGSIKNALSCTGPPDPLIGTALYESVRKTAKELLDFLFDPETLENEKSVSEVSKLEDAPPKSQLGGLGSSVTAEKKYDGFGSSPIQKEETVTEKMIDTLSKILQQPDNSSEIVKNALSSPVGNYQPVTLPPDVGEYTIPPPREPQQMPVRVKAHIPGRAGGGWDSDEDVLQSQDMAEQDNLPGHCSITSETEKSVDGQGSDRDMKEMSTERDIVLEFCSEGALPVPRQKLVETFKKCSTLNCVDILHVVSGLLNPESSEATLIRALLLIECFLRTDHVALPMMSQILSKGLDQLRKSDNVTESAKIKAHKVILILDKLQSSYQQQG